MTPSHAYVPSRTPRHPEDLFDGVKSTVRKGMDATALEASEAWRTGLGYYRDGYFWECHEVLEAVWMASRTNSPERRVTQGLIQLANARLKARMGRPNAVRRLADIAGAHFAEARLADGPVMGLTGEWVRAELAKLLEKAQRDA